jgi:RNA polymerase sigma factor (sigma-70 family)
VQAYADSELVHDLARDLEFERIYRRYVRDVYRYTLAVLRNPADAEDITQTTFLNAYRAYLRGEEPLRPRHWLIKIAHNACRSRHLRAVRRPQEVPFEETAAALRVPSEEASKVEELLAALGRLPFNQRAALVMRELEGRSYAEISETLDVSVSAVETLIFRARRTLRRDRSLLGVLGAVPLPPSLGGLFAGGGGGAVAGSGAAAGSGLLFKVLMAVTAAVVAGTVGTGVDKVLAKNRGPGATAALEPQRPAVFATGVAATPGAADGALGPIVVVREGSKVVVIGGAFGTEQVALLGSAYTLGAGAGSGPGAPLGSTVFLPVGDPQSAGAEAVGSSAPSTSTATSTPSAAASSVAAAAAMTAPVSETTDTVAATTDTVAATTDPVAETTSALPAPAVPSAPATPSPPATPPPPVAVPPVPVVPTPDVPTPDVPTPQVPALPPPPHLP